MKHIFAQVLKRLAKGAVAGCGLVYEIYLQKFSREVDEYSARLSDDVAGAFIKFATTQFDYVAESERYPGDDEDCCQHWFEYGECPAGCERAELEEY